MLIKLIRNIYYKYFFIHKTPHELIEIHGGTIGTGVFIGTDVIIDYDYAFLLEIGDGAVISARSIVELHDSCLPNVLGKGKLKVGRVKIGNRAYIGVNSVILPGVEIGDGAIVGACSLVNTDIPRGEVWAGNPVRYLGTVEDLRMKRTISASPAIAYFDWIGELEKRDVNYEVSKLEFIKNVRLYFQDLQRYKREP